MSLSASNSETDAVAGALHAEVVAEQSHLAEAQSRMPPAPAEVAPIDPTAAASNSYSQIFKSSSMVGSAQAVTLLLGMARVKGAALLIGPAGVGEVSMLISATQLLANVS